MAYPCSVFIIDGVILILLMGGVRLGRRIWREISGLRGDEPVLIYGAGDVGETLVREMRRDPKRAREPIGFIDDDPTKTVERIHGVPVFGTSADLPVVMAREPCAAL